MARQNERQRLRRRLQDYAMDLANTNQWHEAVDTNRQILDLGEDAPTYNRLGKAYMELGMYEEALDAYQQTLRVNPINTIARRNLARLEVLLARISQNETFSQKERKLLDLGMFVTEAGKTILTSLLDVPSNAVIDMLATGERVELHVTDHTVQLLDTAGSVLGRLEPRIGQRLAQLIGGGNRYTAAIVQSDSRQVRIIIREIFQDPSQRGRTSFPGRLVDETTGYLPSTRYEYDLDDLLEDEENIDENDAPDTDFAETDEEPQELRLEEIEKDLNDDDNEDE